MNGAAAAPSQPVGAGDYYPSNDHYAPPQSDAESNSNQTDILARIARLERRVAQLQEQALFAEQADVELAEDVSPSTTAPLIVVVRKLRDHTVEEADLEFLAFSEITLEPNGDLDLSKLSFATSGDEFLVREPNTGGLRYLSPDDPSIIFAGWVKSFVSYEDDVYKFLDIIELQDANAADRNYERNRRARGIAGRGAHLKGLVRRPFTWVASLAFHPLTSTEKHSEVKGKLNVLELQGLHFQLGRISKSSQRKCPTEARGR